MNLFSLFLQQNVAMIPHDTIIALATPAGVGAIGLRMPVNSL